MPSVTRRDDSTSSSLTTAKPPASGRVDRRDRHPPRRREGRTALIEEVPGEFSSSIDAPKPGTYYIEIKPADAKQSPFPPLAYTVSPAVNAELPRPQPNYGLLEHLASATGGRLNPSTEDVELTRPTLERREALDPYLVVAAMLLLIAEALVRRLTV